MTYPTRPKSNFRFDINGLRAWAVGAVVLFHFAAPGFSGGFVGVDIFFVISGFLMTNIIVTGLEGKREGGSFSVWSFYLARAKRIWPALLVLCAVLLALGWVFLTAPDYRLLATHALGAISFLSNIQFWNEAGYFDAASHDKWLLHTWTLSVEWQFYLLLPLLLSLVWHFFPGRRNAFIALAAVMLCSFALSVWQTDISPAKAFFLLPTRAWEMLVGGVVALVAARSQLTPQWARCSEWLGFALIVIAVTSAKEANWPGYHALLPVAGTAMVLMAARQHSVLTAPRLFQRLGDWSYSIYLWHWPIVVALVYVGWQGQTKAVLGGLALSILLGWASYRWVEALGRKRLNRLSAKRAMAVLASAALLVALPALAVRDGQGIPSRIKPAASAAAAQAHNFNTRRQNCHLGGGDEFRSCVYGGTNIRAIVVGDSHANAVVSAVQAALPSSQDGVLAFSYTSCPTIFGVRQERKDLKCAEFNEWVLTQIANIRSDIPLIIVNRSSSYPLGEPSLQGAGKQKPLTYFDGAAPTDSATPAFLQNYEAHLVASACRIAKTRTVYLLRPIPEMPVNVPSATAKMIQLGIPSRLSITVADYHRRHNFIWAAQDKAQAFCGVQLLDPLPYLCDERLCFGADGNVPRYYDDNHMSEAGNRRLVPLFREVFNAQLKQNFTRKKLGN